MPVTFSRAGDIFDVYQGNGTFRVNHKGVDILDFHVTDDTPDPDPTPDPTPDPDPVPPSDTTPPVVKINRVGTDLIVYSSTEEGTAFWMVNGVPGALLGGFIASAGNSFSVSKTGTSERVIDLSGLPAGVYYMHLTVRDDAGNYSADVPQVFEVVV